TVAHMLAPIEEPNALRLIDRGLHRGGERGDRRWIRSRAARRRMHTRTERVNDLFAKLGIVRGRRNAECRQRDFGGPLALIMTTDAVGVDQRARLDIGHRRRCGYIRDSWRFTSNETRVGWAAHTL